MNIIHRFITKINANARTTDTHIHVLHTLYSQQYSNKYSQSEI